MSEYTPTETDIRAALENRGFTQQQTDSALRQLRADVWRKAADFLQIQRNLDDDLVPGVRLSAITLRWRAGQIENGDDDE